MATITLLRQKFVNKLITPNKTQWRLAQKSIGTIDRDTLIREAASHSRLSESELSSALNALSDTAALFLGIGHGVQLGNLGTLSLSISSKAVDSEADCTADCIRNVSVNLRAIGRLAKAINEFKFRVAGVAAEGDGNGTNDDDNGGGGQQGGQGSQAVQHTMTFRFAGGTTQTAQLAEGATITYPANTTGYMWPSNKPVTMPNQDTTVTEVTSGLGGGDDSF